MIAILAVTLISVLILALYLWLVLTFGLRTRKTTFHTPPRTPVPRRQKQTLWIVTDKNDPAP